MSELTDKQAAFVRECLIGLNPTQAAIRAGHRLPRCRTPAGFYVYLLTDNRNGEIFYVGKGNGKRFAAHEREYRTFKVQNARKCFRIGQVIESGGTVIPYCFADGLSEDDAFVMAERAGKKSFGAPARDRTSARRM